MYFNLFTQSILDQANEMLIFDDFKNVAILLKVRCIE